jgi:hypothetical protein
VSWSVRPGAPTASYARRRSRLGRHGVELAAREVAPTERQIRARAVRVRSGELVGEGRGRRRENRRGRRVEPGAGQVPGRHVAVVAVVAAFGETLEGRHPSRIAGIGERASLPIDRRLVSLGLDEGPERVEARRGVLPVPREVLRPGGAPARVGGEAARANPIVRGGGRVVAAGGLIDATERVARGRRLVGAREALPDLVEDPGGLVVVVRVPSPPPCRVERGRAHRRRAVRRQRAAEPGRVRRVAERLPGAGRDPARLIAVGASGGVEVPDEILRPGGIALAEAQLRLGQSSLGRREHRWILAGEPSREPPCAPRGHGPRQARSDAAGLLERGRVVAQASRRLGLPELRPRPVGPIAVQLGRRVAEPRGRSGVVAGSPHREPDLEPCAADPDRVGEGRREPRCRVPRLVHVAPARERGDGFVRRPVPEHGIVRDGRAGAPTQQRHGGGPGDRRDGRHRGRRRSLAERASRRHARRDDMKARPWDAHAAPATTGCAARQLPRMLRM